MVSYIAAMKVAAILLMVGAPESCLLNEKICSGVKKEEYFLLGLFIFAMHGSFIIVIICFNIADCDPKSSRIKRIGEVGYTNQLSNSFRRLFHSSSLTWTIGAKIFFDMDHCIGYLRWK